MQLFWSRGYEAVSLADLLDATGLSKSSLYATFGSKHAMFLAAFDLYRASRKHDMDLVLSQPRGRDGIDAFFRMIVHDLRSPAQGSGCMSINQAVELAPHDPEVQRRVETDFALIETGLRAAVERGQADESIQTTRPPHELAQLLVLAFPGLQVMVRAGLDPARVDRTLEQLLSLLD